MAVFKILEAITLTLVSLSAFLGNSILFVLVLRTPSLRTKGNVFILNLAMADLLVSAFNMPLIIVTVITEDWILGDKLCLVTGFFTLLTFVASCMALALISINRYHAIVHWTSYKEKYSRKKCCIYLTIMWTITISLCVPPLFGWASFHFDKNQSFCFADWHSSKSYTLFMICACLLGPLIAMSYCYIKIFKYQKLTAKTVERTGSRSTVDSVQTVISYAPERTRKKLTKTILILITAFAICWSPFALIMILQVFFNISVPRSADFGSLILGCFNSFCNVVVYNATNKKLRKAYKDFVFSCCRRENSQQVPRESLETVDDFRNANTISSHL